MKKKKNTIYISALVIAIFTIIVVFSQCGCGMVRHAETKSTLQISGNQIDPIATKSIIGMVEEDSIEYELKEAGPKVIKRKITLKGHHGDEAEYRQRTVLRQSDFKQTNTAYIIKHDFDLMCGTIVMPVDCELVFEGGSLNNGIIVGNNTSIVYTGTIFNGIGIKGNWNVPEIHSTMFGDATKCTDRLRDVIALTNENVENCVFVESGEYLMEVRKYSDKLLPLNNNTTLILDGTIKVIGSSFPRYCVIAILDASDVTIKGKGMIKGDRDLHRYTPEVADPESVRGLNSSHEYGHGINIENSKNVSVSDITITKCIGDGVRIVGQDITCRNLKVRECRRQGITIAADRLLIDKCEISEIWGVNKAGFGVDIETDNKHPASFIVVSDCKITSCNGGLNMQCHSFESVKNIVVKNCFFSTFAQDKLQNHEQYRAIMCFGARDCQVTGCTIEDSNTCLVYVENAVNITFRDNRMTGRGSRYGIVLRKNRGNVSIDKNHIYLYEGDSQNLSGSAVANLHNAVVTNNEFHSKNLSVTGDTPCKNVVLRGNTINAQWESNVEVNSCIIENNTFTRKVSFDNVVESTVEGNTMQSLRVKRSNNSRINYNTTR